MNDLTWNWEIEVSGGGPHFYLQIDFDLSHQELTRLAEPLLQEFERQSGTLWEQPGGSEWRYAAVEIQNNRISITRGWGWSESRDARLARQMLDMPGFSFWRVLAGGEWYTLEFFHSGTGAQSLIEYSRAQVLEPDFDAVLEQLRASLESRGLCEKYTLGEPQFERGSMRVPVLYDVLRVGDAWHTEPAASEMIGIACEVSDRCGVPALASAASLRPPDDFHNIIGGSFSFGARHR